MSALTLIANENAHSGSCVDRLQNSSRVLTLIVTELYLYRYIFEKPLWSRAFTTKVVAAVGSSFGGKSWSSAERHRRGKDEERTGMVCADMGKQWKIGESESYCKSNSNARETQAHRCKAEK